MADCYWNGAVDGDYSDAGNWSGAVPVTGDNVIFDGRTTQSVDVVTGMDQTGVNLASFTVKSTYTGSIGDSDYDTGSGVGPLLTECSGVVLIEGSGNYYLQCGNDANDADCATTIINTTGTVELSSQKNANAGNLAEWTDVWVIKGTVNIKGKADAAKTTTAAGAPEDGTWVKNLYVCPTRSGGVTVVIGDQCEDYKTPDTITIKVTNGGTCTAYTDIKLAEVHDGGKLYYGGTGYSMDADDDNITTLYVYKGGTFYWLPSVVASSIRTTASASAAITTAYIMGVFDATDVLETLTTAPTITTIYQHDSSEIKLDNGYGNIVVTNDIYHYGGKLTVDSHQAVGVQ